MAADAERQAGSQGAAGAGDGFNGRMAGAAHAAGRDSMFSFCRGSGSGEGGSGRSLLRSGRPFTDGYAAGEPHPDNIGRGVGDPDVIRISHGRRAWSASAGEREGRPISAGGGATAGKTSS